MNIRFGLNMTVCLCALSVMAQTNKVQDQQLKRNVNDKYESKLNGSVKWLEKEEWTKAISNLSDVIHLNPEEPRSYQYRSWAYLSTGGFNEAIADLTKLIELERVGVGPSHLSRRKNFVTEKLR